MPSVAAWYRENRSERDAISSLLKDFALQRAAGRSPDRESVQRVAECVERHRGVESALARAQLLGGQARSQIEPFVDCEAKHAMLALADFVVRPAELVTPVSPASPAFLTPTKERQGLKMRATIVRATSAFALVALLCNVAVAAGNEPAGRAGGAAIVGVVNVNSATAEELALLPGVGPAKAL